MPQVWTGEGWTQYDEPAQAPAPQNWDEFWRQNSGGGGASRTVPQLAQQMGMDFQKYQNWVNNYMASPGYSTDSAAGMRQFALDNGYSSAQADQLGQQSAASLSDWQGQQANLNADHGMGTFLTLLALGVGGGALAAGGLGAGVGANAAGAMGLEAGAAGSGLGGLGLGAGEGLVGWDALGNAAAGGLGEVGSLAGGDMAAGWGVNQGAEAMDVWDLMGNLDMYGLGNGGVDADLLALLDSPAGGGGSMADWWSQAAGAGSNYGASDLLNIAGLPSTSGLSNVTDFLKSMGLSGDSLTNAVSKMTGGLLGGLFGGDTGDWLGKSAGLAAILGSMAYGDSRAGVDLNNLNSLYDQYNPQAQMGMYDLNTEYGRRDLMSGLAKRGVAGSSFGNADIYNYNTTRDIGRGQALNQGVSGAANLANSIALWQNQENKNKTDLIGRGLYSIGTLFGGK